MASNYKDIYIRKNPLKNIKCNPLYVDSYKPYIENFENMNNSANPVSGFNNDDNYNYINDKSEENKIKLLCKDNKYLLKNKGIEKMYDLNLNELMKRKKKGNIESIDMLHNKKILNTMGYDDSRLISVNNFSNRLMRNLNEKVVRSNELSNLDDPFFSHPAHNNYRWKNSYFKNGWVENINNNPKPIDFKNVIDYRNKKQGKINYNIINYKN